MKKLLTYMMLLLILTACSSDDHEEEALLTEGDVTLVSFTRATWSPKLAKEEYSSIGVFLVKAGSNTQPGQGQFHYRQNDSRWHSNIEVTSGLSYRLYGYAPADAVESAISEESEAGVTMTFTKLPSVSSQDICFVVGVQHMTEATGTKDIKLGQFAFTGGSQDHNFINLQMDHLYAGLCFQMTIDSDYALLRRIKIKKMELQTSSSTTTTTVKLVANNSATSPVSDVSYGSPTGEQLSATFFKSTDGEVLSADVVKEAMCCFVPILGNDLTLVTTYDVYDRNDNKIAERTASNKLPNLTVARGDLMTLLLKVNPTYLYVLSEPDLDNPTITVN